MIKKIVLLLAIFLAVGQNVVFAQVKYEQNHYLENLQKRVESSWLIPSDSNGKSAVVSFIINKDGHATNVGLVRSSNDIRFDDSAIAAVGKVLSYEKPANETPLTIQIFFSPAFTNVAILNPEDQGIKTKDANIIDVANRKSFVDFTSYTANLESKIDSNWAPEIEKKERNAIFSVDIDKNGSLSDISIIKSSCSKKFDRNIYDAISNSVPMEILPAGFSADSTNVQLVFNYTPQENASVPAHYLTASVNPTKGYDDYVKLVQKVISSRIDGRRYFFTKDLGLEIVINSDGKLNYVKIKKPSKDANFDRKIIAALQTASFPTIPRELGMDSVKLNYQALTQRGYPFPGVVSNAIFYLGTTKLKSFPI